MFADKDHSIHTAEGIFVGTVEKSGVISFKGIPFAKPPVGEMRWQPPQPNDPSDLVMYADKFPPAPMQPEMPQALAARLHEAPHTPQSEDCLYLNMWCWDVTTPKKAILFWIYGGSFSIGHASRLQERGEALVAENHDLVVVSCNYRLGIFGSANLSALDPEGTYRYSNNLNLLDQRAALKWVHDNAEAFGGDADRITLYGHSAGSNAICHHLAIPESNMLFQRAICQSSFIVGHGTVPLRAAQDRTMQILEKAGVTTLDQALSISADKLLAAQAELCGTAYDPPVDDGLTVTSGELERLAAGELSGKQLLVGNSTGEYDQMFVGLSAEDAKAKVLSRNAARLGDQGAEKLDAFAKLHSDLSEEMAYATANNELGMTMGGEIQARVCAKYNDVYKFLFAWEDPKTGARAPHGAPCPFVFNTTVPDTAPISLRYHMLDVWSSFIRTGNPNCDGLPQWDTYTSEGGPTMVIDNQWTISDSVWTDDYAFWRECFPETAVIEEGKEGK